MVLIFVFLLSTLRISPIYGAADFRLLRFEKCAFADPKKGNIQCVFDVKDPKALNLTFDFYQPCNEASVSKLSSLFTEIKYKWIHKIKLIKIAVKFGVKMKSQRFKDIFAHTLDWCNLVDTSKSSNYLGRILISSIRNVEQNITKPCPLSGYYAVKNLLPVKAFMSILPVGEIRIAAEINLPDCGTKLFLKYFAEFYDWILISW